MRDTPDISIVTIVRQQFELEDVLSKYIYDVECE